MASLFPFRALRYDPGRVRLADVLTQPYDKITPAMQRRYYAASPFNLVRLELGSKEAEGDVYEGAAAHLQQWRAQGVLRQDDQPSIYAYAQQFAPPAGGPALERRGFVAVGRLEDYDRKVVFRHELTLSGPKTDRLNLLRATRACFGLLFMLYQDPKLELETLLFPARPPDSELTDEFGVGHRMWRCSDTQTIARVQAFMSEKQLIIADGHHRYETAMNYRNERRTAAANGSDPNASYERAMMTFVNMESPGLVILPTHRVVHGLAMFDPEQLLRGAKRYFEIEDLDPALDAAGAAAALHQATGGTSLVAFTGARNFLLHARRDATDALLPDLSPRQRALDVAILHRVLLQQVLGISEVAIREQRNLAYLRDAAEAIERVRCGAAEVAFLMNPVRIEQMREVAFAGEVMPQKSTDFYPKLLSGLVGYALD
ncbi:MAG TPA: DUF1015 domain-containing protein [Terriglobales bacterium]|nr:DUF1015 domain-containing protein [Terriglobales bacterium]